MFTDGIFINLAAASFLLGIAYCVILLVGRKTINQDASRWLSSAIVAFLVGARMCHVTLGLFLSPDYTSATFDEDMTLIFELVSTMIWLFGGMAALFLTCFTVTQMRHLRQSRSKIMPILQSVTGVTSMFMTALLVYLLWSPAYLDAFEAKREYDAPLTVQVERDGTVMFEGRNMSCDELLNHFWTDESDTPTLATLLITADPALEYSVVEPVLDECRRAYHRMLLGITGDSLESLGLASVDLGDAYFSKQYRLGGARRGPRELASDLEEDRRVIQVMKNGYTVNKNPVAQDGMPALLRKFYAEDEVIRVYCYPDARLGDVVWLLKECIALDVGPAVMSLVGDD